MPPAAGQAPTCVRRAEQIEGPFFRDLKLNRSDIRSDPADAGAVKPGIPLRMVFRVGRIEGSACRPLIGAMVDFWQCDVQGAYSNFDQAPGKQFLRGYQLTDGTGVVEFLTIFPGAYAGRAVHTHFKIRMDPQAPRTMGFTSQIYFPEPINEEVFAQPPYTAAGRVRNAQDAFFTQDGGTSLIPKMSKSGAGWLGEFDIGLATV
jgi:protocatechuate 3,4-dioxygenase beta subunit